MTASAKVDYLLVVFITLLLSEIIQVVVYICTAFIISHGEGLTCTYTSLMMTGGSLPLLSEEVLYLEVVDNAHVGYLAQCLRIGFSQGGTLFPNFHYYLVD